MPVSGVLAEIGAGEIGTLALYGAQALQIEGDRWVGIVASRDELAGERAGRARLAQPIKDPAPLAEAVQETGLAKQLQVARHPWLTLPKNLGQLSNCELAAGAKHHEPQPRRLGNGAQCGEEVFHQFGFCSTIRNIYRYLYMCKPIVQFEMSIPSMHLSVARISRNYLPT